MNPEISKILDEVNRKIGRNLLRYQYIEIFLKQIIPYAHSENKIQPYFSDEGVDIDKLGEYKNRVQSQTLGGLVEEFKKFTEIPVDFFGQAIEKTKDERNRLVHNFLEIPDVEYLNTINGVNYALKYLDDKFNEANELFEFMRLQSLALLIAKLDTASEYCSEAKDQLNQLISVLPDGFEIICPDDPSRAEWTTTRVVRLLQLAESQTRKVGEMTLLSRAGKFIKNTSPDLSPKEYGLKSLKEILLASGLFDVSIQKNEAGNSVILYKSKG